MKIKVFRSLWGLESETWESLFPRLKKLGYSGIEASLGDIGSRFSNVVQILKEYELELICGIYTAWNDYEDGKCDVYKSIDEHLVQFRSELKKAVLLHPIRINVHGGSDSWTEEEMDYFYERVLKIQEEEGNGVLISHETHRGRALFSPFITYRILNKFPSLRVTADFSHWVVVSERLLHSEKDTSVMKLCASRANHIHARVGYSQKAQVPDPRISQFQEEVNLHQKWWEWIWEFQKEQGFEFVTLTTEFGPPPYTQTNLNGEPVNDFSEICDWQMNNQKQLFRLKYDKE